MDEFMDELVGEFLTETRESLEILDQEIVQLEQNPNDKGLLGNIFRVVHTVKGTCGFLGLSRLEKVAHSGENVLGLYRDGVLPVTSDSVTLILQSLDRIKEIVDGIEQTGSEPEGDDSELISKLDAVVDSAEGGAEEDDIFTPVPADQTAAVADALASEANTVAQEDIVEEDIVEEAVENHAPVEPVPVQPETSKTEEKKKEDTTPKTSAPVSNQTLRVNVDVLENLMTMVSEMVLTRNQLLQILRTNGDTEFAAPLQRLNHVVSDLQEGVMKTRMQPIGNAWSKLPRIIRDLSQELGKKIDLDMRGKDTELDRQVLDLIKDPLTHMVRNSADHGIEMPAERAAAGKSETGTVILDAFHEGGHIIITISDDGKGIPVEKIKQKAIEKELITEAQAAEMPDNQIQSFIFHPGFSTAEQVTSVSGRGVGMDVVRTNIEKIGGTVELQSTEGKGSVFTIKIPLTLAIVSALIVESAGERFAVPQLSVQELVRASSGEDGSRIEYIKGAPVLRLRDKLLPLISLKKTLQLNVEQETPTEEDVSEEMITSEKDGDYIIVTQVGAYSFGVIVDRVFDTEEIVVKPVSPILRNIDVFAGNTILGDGNVIMILDPNGIANMAGEMVASDASAALSAQQAEMKESYTQEEKQSLLVVRVGQGAPKAVPLSLVSRLESVSDKEIELANGNYIVQYRGQLMPLIPFNDAVVLNDGSTKPVLVFSDHLRSMGLVVDEIVDIVETVVTIETSTAGNGVLGSAIIEGKATDVVDVGYYLNQGHGDWFAVGETTNPFADSRQKRILLVDDSPFFRNMLVPLLTVAGYQVVAAEGPEQAMVILQKEAPFDVVVSDIEMPDINGFEFAQKVRASEEYWKDLPMIALSSHATPADVSKGKEVGFDDYVPKFDRDTILGTLNKALNEKQGNDNSMQNSVVAVEGDRA